MKIAEPTEIFVLERKNGRAPFVDWLDSIADKRFKMAVQFRITQLRAGTLGNYKSLGHGVFELKVHLGPGFRVYFSFLAKDKVLLVLGGDKKSQKRDILKAKHLLSEYKDALKKL